MGSLEANPGMYKPASSPQKLYLADRFSDLEQYLAKPRTINNTDFSSGDNAKTICTNLHMTKAFSESFVTARVAEGGAFGCDS